MPSKMHLIHPLSLTKIQTALIKSICCLMLCTIQGTVQSAEPTKFLSLKELRERGIVMQKWENSCASASLATVMSYAFHDPISETEVTTEMLKHSDPVKVKTNGGFSMLDMKKFAELHGYHADAFRNLSLDDLIIFRAPIVLINNEGINHYVVFNGIEGDYVQLADPEFGNRQVSIVKFNKIWMNGMAFVLTMEK